MPLRIVINHNENSVTFTGDTFQYKEQIKSLGNARWQGVQKAWEIRPAVSSGKLQEVFPDALIEEKGETKKGHADGEVTFWSDEQDVADVFGTNDSGNVSNPQTTTLPQSLSISEFLTKAKIVLQNAFAGAIYIRGKLSKVSASSGRMFIEVVDLDAPDERVDCVVWQNADSVFAPLFKSGFKLEADLPVMLQVKVDLNKKGSRLSLHIIGVVAEYTSAKIAAERDITNQKLKEEGIFEQNKKLKLTFLPKRLGILTSPTGTVINDFCAALETAGFGFELFWYKVNVQGDTAVREILKGLKYLDQREDLDAILIFRGGGSPAELGVFNNYEIAKRVCMCSKPVVSAVGHQADQCSVQDVSFVACGVPKEIGYFFANIVLDIKRQYGENIRMISNRISVSLETYSLKIKNIRETFPIYIRMFVKKRSELFSQLAGNFPAYTQAFIRREENRISVVFDSLVQLANRVFTLKKEAFKQQLGGRLLVLLTVKQRLALNKLSGTADVLHGIKRAIELKGQSLEHLGVIVEGLDPKKQLKRGFSLVRKAGKDADVSSPYITAASGLASGEEIRIEFYEGSREAVVK